MKRYLYSIYTMGRREFKNSGWELQGTPYMPKVLAEKTAKTLNRTLPQKGRRIYEKYVAMSTQMEIKDGTPHGFADWYAYWAGRRSHWQGKGKQRKVRYESDDYI